MMRGSLRPAARAMAVATLAILLVACGSGSSSETRFPDVLTLGGGELFPAIANHSLGVGPERVSIAITDRDGNAVLDVAVNARFFDLNGKAPTPKAEVDARFVPVDLSYIDEQSVDRRTPAGRGGVYVTNVDFDTPGDWGMMVTVTRDGRASKPIPFRFTVLEHTPEPAVGDPAPPSRQATLADVRDLGEVDSSYPLRPAMHDTTVAAAIEARRPAVIAFATPAFCESRTCAPVMDTVMDPLAATYAGRAAFIHVEPYVLKDLREANVRRPVPATQEWRLQSEPWVFVVGADGRIAAKFEGPAALDEVRSALDRALAAAPGT